MKKLNNKRPLFSLRQAPYQICNRKKSGFTLIEIIVVLIIVGILAAIALPNLFSNIAKSKGGQALVSIDGIKTNLEAYYTLHSGQTPVAGNGDLTAAGATKQAVISGVTFNFTIAAAAAAQGAATEIGRASCRERAHIMV